MLPNLKCDAATLTEIYCNGIIPFYDPHSSATVGQFVGSGASVLLVRHIGNVALLLVVCFFIEAGLFCTQCISSSNNGIRTDFVQEERPTGNPKSAVPVVHDWLESLLEGWYLLWQSEYLTGIWLYTLLYAITGTLLYLERSELVRLHIEDVDERAVLCNPLHFSRVHFSLLFVCA
jgi:hypothetical protein